MTPPGFEAATFRLVSQCLKQLRHRVPRLTTKLTLIEDKILFLTVIKHVTFVSMPRVGRTVQNHGKRTYEEFDRRQKYSKKTGSDKTHCPIVSYVEYIIQCVYK